MHPAALITIITLGWIGLIALIRWAVLPWFAKAPGGIPINAPLWPLLRAYARLWHRTRHRGQERLRTQSNPGGLIVVSNHTSAVDPLLIQAGCRFHIRWLMASDMMIPDLDWLWKQQRVIPVSRDGRDAAALREAIRHVRNGGVLGLFPEGRIVTRGEIRPFFTGVGMIATRAKAPVLLVWTSGTPETERLTAAFFRPGRARVEYIDLMQFDHGTDPKDAARRMRERLSEASGWPLNDRPMTPEEEQASSVYRTGAADPSQHVMRPTCDA